MRLKILVIVLLILTSTSFGLLLIGNNIDAISPDDGVNGEQYLVGTWAIINFPESYTDEIIYLTGNLTSYNALTLINSSLKMNSSASTNYIINFFTSSSNLTLEENSIITAADTQYPYDIVFNTGSQAYIKNSTFSYAGYKGGPSEGILVKSDDIVFVNSLITNNYNGLNCSSVSPMLFDSRIENSVNKDMVLKGNSHPLVINTSLDKTKVDIQDTSSLEINWYFSLSVTNETKAALSDVKVTFKNATGIITDVVKTDNNGKITNLVLPECTIHPGGTVDHSPYTIELEKKNYTKAILEGVNVTKSRSIDTVMSSKPQSGIINGTVTDENGNPLVNVIVTVVKDDNEIATGYSNETGFYEISDIPEDTGYTVTASLEPGYEVSSAVDVSVVGDQTTNIDFNLTERELPLTVAPVHGSIDISTDIKITVIFEEEMNASSVDINFDLIENITGVTISGTWNISDNNTVFEFTPGKELKNGEEYIVRILKSVRNATGDKPLWKNFEAKFKTLYPPPVVVTYSPTGDDISTGKQIFIAFSQSMNITSFESAFQITPTGTLTFTWNEYEENPDAIVTIDYELKAGTKYNISIDTRATSIHGVPLENIFSWEFSTKPNVFTGRIVDEDNNPIEGATVTVEGFTLTETDENGSFTITGLPEGQHTINVTIDGYYSFEETIQIQPGDNNFGTKPLNKITKDKEADEDEGISGNLAVAYVIIIALIIIIFVLLAFISVERMQTVPEPSREERVDYLDLTERGEGEEEKPEAPPAPAYRGRCPVCKHSVYGDYCFHCATSGGSSSYMYSEEEQT